MTHSVGVHVSMRQPQIYSMSMCMSHLYYLICLPLLFRVTGRRKYAHVYIHVIVIRVGELLWEFRLLAAILIHVHFTTAGSQVCLVTRFHCGQLIVDIVRIKLTRRVRVVCKRLYVQEVWDLLTA